MSLIAAIVQLFELALFARIILSWFPIRYGSPLQPVVRVLIQITEPVLAPVRRVLPPMGGLDLSPIVVVIAINILMAALNH